MLTTDHKDELIKMQHRLTEICNACGVSAIYVCGYQRSAPYDQRYAGSVDVHINRPGDGDGWTNSKQEVGGIGYVTFRRGESDE